MSSSYNVVEFEIDMNELEVTRFTSERVGREWEVRAFVRWPNGTKVDDQETFYVHVRGPSLSEVMRAMFTTARQARTEASKR